MFYDGWMGLVRVVVAGTCAYAALVLLLRISGKRTLAKLNAFDFVVTVALGSTLATVVLSSSVALAEGVVALALPRSPAVRRGVGLHPKPPGGATGEVGADAGVSRRFATGGDAS